MANRATYGDGGISKEKRNGKILRDTWRVSICCGSKTVTDKDGRKRKVPNRITRIVHGSKADARAVRDKLNRDYAGLNFEAANDTFSAACNAWYSALEVANTAGELTMNAYRSQLDHMRARIGDMPLVDVKKQDVENALADIKANDGIGNTTLHKVFAVTKRVFSYAIDNCWLVKNPCARVRAPRIDPVTNRRSLTEEECARFRAALDNAESAAIEEFKEKESRQTDRGNLFGRSAVRGISDVSRLIGIRVIAATGMRRGEALALTWGAVDFDAQQIRVEQSITSKLEVKPPKNGKPRSLYVDSATIEHLKSWKALQASALQRVTATNGGRVETVRQTDETPVVCNDQGSWLCPRNFSVWWEGYHQENGFRDELGFPTLKIHELRHTHATLLLGHGADLKTVQTRLGHSSASLTLNQYAHAIPANDKAAADLMGDIFAQPAKTEAEIVSLKSA